MKERDEKRDVNQVRLIARDRNKEMLYQSVFFTDIDLPPYIMEMFEQIFQEMLDKLAEKNKNLHAEPELHTECCNPMR